MWKRLSDLPATSVTSVVASCPLPAQSTLNLKVKINISIKHLNTSFVFLDLCGRIYPLRVDLSVSKKDVTNQGGLTA